MPQNNRRVPSCVLVARFSALGDVAMTIPVLYSACRCNESTRFVFITRPSMVSMFVNAPSNLEVVGVDLKERYKGAGGMWRLFKNLCSRYPIDAFADLHGVLRTHALRMFCHLHGIRACMINKGRMHKHALTRSHNKVMLPLISSRARYREVFYRLGLTLEDRFRTLYDEIEADPGLFASVTAPKKSGETWVGIAPFAKHPGKIYPLPLMEKVVAEIASWPDTKVFLFGAGADESAVLSEWASQYDNVVSLADKRLGFAVELALLRYMDTMVTMDSANMHLASLVGVRVVSVWGATHPYCGFKGFRQHEADIVQLTMTCRPCSVFGDKPCARGDYHCLAGIPPQIITSRVRTIINQRHGYQR